MDQNQDELQAAINSITNQGGAAGGTNDVVSQVTNKVADGLGAPAAPAVPETPAMPPAVGGASMEPERAMYGDPDLDRVKSMALSDLRPILEKIDIAPEKKFMIYKDIIELTDDKACIEPAYNAAKQIVVWNPGCGKGTETYSLACVLKKRYPDAKIRIYAQDIDLLNVSNAGLMSVPANLASDWYSPYLTKKANGEYTFSQEIKDSIMFEYHDCKNTNALPMVDVIFARDILSLLDEKAQESVVADFIEKMKGNAVAIIGENEEMPDSFSFGENASGTLVAYTKD